jgi:carbamoyl-phosphate synthase large subunit
MMSHEKKCRNVLIFPAGTEIGLEIYNALSCCKEVNLFGAGLPLLNHAEFLMDNYINLPRIDDPNFINELIKVIEIYKIDYIFPAYDDVILALSKIKHKLTARVLAPSEGVCEITRYKSKTYKKLQHIIPTPNIYTSYKQIQSYPVFIKPDKGQGSQGARIVNSVSELPFSWGKNGEFIVCEYLPGNEYTIDCFSDREMGLLFASPRIRGRVRNGISVNTSMVNLDIAWTYASRICEVLHLYGAWFFQVKESDDGELKLLEVAPRIAGSMALHRVLGVNFPLLTIFEEERLPISICINKGEVVLDRALGNRFKHSFNYTTLYIDLDDTLIIKGKVNLNLITLIYKSINELKKIILLTRHAGDLTETLVIHKLTNLFDEIIHIPPAQKKSEFINCQGAIFIDDSYFERMDVKNNCGIPTFDTSMLELLTNGVFNENI